MVLLICVDVVAVPVAVRVGEHLYPQVQVLLGRGTPKEDNWSVA